MIHLERKLLLVFGLHLLIVQVGCELWESELSAVVSSLELSLLTLSYAETSTSMTVVHSVHSVWLNRLSSQQTELIVHQW